MNIRFRPAPDVFWFVGGLPGGKPRSEHEVHRAAPVVEVEVRLPMPTIEFVIPGGVIPAVPMVVAPPPGRAYPNPERKVKTRRDRDRDDDDRDDDD